MDNTKALPMSLSRRSNPLATHLGGADMLGTENVEPLAESEKKKEAFVDNAESSQETALKEVKELGIFNPTDLEAITCLVKKIRGQELPRNAVVNEVDLYESDPQTLTEDYKLSKQGDNWYFFTRTRTSRLVGDNGFWKYGSTRGINNLDGREIGRRRPFYYFLGEQSKKDDQIHTGWCMQEYIAEKGSNEIGTKKYESYALCKVYHFTPRKSVDRGKEEENKSKKLRRYEPSLAQNLSIHQNSDNPTEDRDNSVKFHDFLPVNTDSSDTKCHSGVEEQREDHEDHEEERGEDDNADWDYSVEFYDFFKVNTDSSDTKHHSGVEEQRGEDHEDHEEERGEDDNADRNNSVQFQDFLKVNTDFSDTKRHSGVEEQRGEDDNADWDNSVQFYDFLKVNTDTSDTKRHSGVEEQRREDHEDQEEERGEDHEYHEEKRSTMPFIDFMGVDRKVHEDNDEKAS